MQIRYVILLTGLCLAAVVAGVFRSEWQPGVLEGPVEMASPAVTPETREWLEGQMRRRGIPGLAIAVVRGGKLQERVALGVANAWTRDPLTVDTLMELASISKVVTGLAAMKEVEAGRLSLDRPLTGYRPDFEVTGEYADDITLGMLLTHTAGLTNALDDVPEANREPGVEFRYSGQGFELAGELVAAGRGESLPVALRRAVLDPLGLSSSATYGIPSGNDVLASPHLSASVPMLLFLAPALAILVTGGLLVWLVRRLRGRRGPADITTSAVLTSIAVMGGLALPFLSFSSGNAMRFVPVNLAMVLLLITICWSWRRATRQRFRSTSLLVTVLAILAITWAAFWRPPLPVELRSPGYPASAGLRASVTDMGVFLAALLAPSPEWRDSVETLSTPLIRVNAENQWGPGIGVQEIDGTTTIWHWGINYPTYESLMLGQPETGNGLVVLMNGGPVMLTRGRARYAGLELARQIAARILPGGHGAYWHGIQ